MESLYDILCIQKNATYAEIRSAYRRLAKSHHPDKNDGKGAERMAKISESYTILSNAESRKYYDETGQTKQSNFDTELNKFIINIVFPVIQKHPGLEETNIIKIIQDEAYKIVNQITDEIKKIENEITKINKFLKRLKPKEDSINKVALIIENQKDLLENNVRSLKHDNLMINKCIAYISEYGYEFDKKNEKTPDSLYFGNDDLLEVFKKMRPKF